MVDPYLRQSPLAHLHLDARVASDGGLTDAAVILAELPHRGQLLLRGDTGNPTFRALLDRVKRTVVNATSHQQLPFEKLVEVLQPARNPSHTPIFQVVFGYQE